MPERTLLMQEGSKLVNPSARSLVTMRRPLSTGRP